MTKTNFKYDLETIYEEVNIIVREYKNPNTTKIQRNFLIEDLVNITKELVMNNCKNFLTKYTVTDLTLDEVYAVAIGESLMIALDWFTFEKGNNFMPIWKTVMERRFLNELKKLSSQKASFFRTCVTSSDNTLIHSSHWEDGGVTIMEIVGEKDFSENLCEGISLMELIEEFESVDKYGKVIRCYFIGSPKVRGNAIAKALGREAYGDNERQDAKRTRERFAKFLIKKGYDLEKYDTKKIIKKSSKRSHK